MTVAAEFSKRQKAGLIDPRTYILAVPDPGHGDGRSVGSGGASLNALLAVAESVATLPVDSSLQSMLLLCFAINMFRRYLPLQSATKCSHSRVFLRLLVQLHYILTVVLLPDHWSNIIGIFQH